MVPMLSLCVDAIAQRSGGSLSLYVSLCQQWLPHSRVKPREPTLQQLHRMTERRLRLCDRDEFP